MNSTIAALKLERASIAQNSWAQPLSLIRIGLCLVFLLRHEHDLPAPFDFERDIWGPGSEYGLQTLAPALPAFAPPLIPGLDALLPYSDLVCRLRLVLVLLLLLGILPRFNAALLALVSFGLFAADGFRYLHHVLVLYVSLFFLAFSHGASSEPPLQEAKPPFALILLRAHVASVYLAAGLAKCSLTWMSGATMRALAREGIAQGQVMDLGVRVLGYQGLALTACAAEIGAALLLALPRTRRAGLVLALGLHAFIQATMQVSTFGMTMLVLLMAFLPSPSERIASDSPQSHRLTKRMLLAGALALAGPFTSYSVGSSIGAYSMFTRLLHYELTLTVDGSLMSRQELTRHLGRDGARIVRLANGHGVGEANVEILRRALPQLTQFVCSLRPKAHSVQTQLSTWRIESGAPLRQEHKADCRSGAGHHVSRRKNGRWNESLPLAPAAGHAHNHGYETQYSHKALRLPEPDCGRAG